MAERLQPRLLHDLIGLLADQRPRERTQERLLGKELLDVEERRYGHVAQSDTGGEQLSRVCAELLPPNGSEVYRGPLVT